jgi:hypothetical protein
LGGNLVPLPVRDVSWFEADGDYEATSKPRWSTGTACRSAALVHRKLRRLRL